MVAQTVVAPHEGTCNCLTFTSRLIGLFCRWVVWNEGSFQGTRSTRHFSQTLMEAQLLFGIRPKVTKQVNKGLTLCELRHSVRRRTSARIKLPNYQGSGPSGLTKNLTL